MDISKFKRINCKKGRQSTYSFMVMNSKGFTFSVKLADQMGNPEFVDVLINEDEKQIALMPSNNHDEEALNFKPRKKGAQARFNNKNLIQLITELTGLNLNESSYRVSGTWHEAETIMIFNLSEAVQVK